MKKLNSKQIQFVLATSVFFNLLFLGYAVKKIHFRYQQHKIRQAYESQRLLPVRQPDSVTYYVARDEVFTILPDDANEIVMLGNSLTHHFEWHEIFKNVNIKNRGINGDITKGVLERLDEVLVSQPDKIFIEIGVNDLLHGYHIDSVFLNYQNIIRQIQQESPGTRIYVQNLLPTSWNGFKSGEPIIEKVYMLNDKLKRFCSEMNLKYIDLFSSFVSNGKLNPKFDCGDNLHLNSAGYMEWCRLIEHYINE